MKPLRRPWVASLLSLASPGLGQLYNGQLLKAVAFLVGIPLLAVPLLWLMMVVPLQPINVLLPIIALLGMQLLSVVEWGPKAVPPDHLFVLGDNRDNNKDSRYWGFLPIGNVLGEARVVYFSKDVRGGYEIRWDRVGHRVR